jgi:hypothetical protein
MKKDFLGDGWAEGWVSEVWARDRARGEYRF